MKNGQRKRKRGQRQKTRSSRASRAPGTPRASAEAAETTRPARPPETTKGSFRRSVLEPWWDREVGRLEFELEQLKVAGIKYKVDEQAKASGLLVIDLQVDLGNGAATPLQALFPDFYPYFRFEIRAPQLDLPYHQHPFSKFLCTLGRRTENWHSSYTLASFIQEQVPKVIESSAMVSRAEADKVEEHQGEPFSDYHSYLENSLILVDSSWKLGTDDAGELIIGLPKIRRRGVELRGGVLEVRDTNNQTIAKAEPKVAQLFPETIRGRWIRSKQPLRADGPELFFTELCKLDRRLEQKQWQALDGYRYDVIGVLFPEEHSWRGAKADGWVFATRAMPFGGDGGHHVYLARAGRAGRLDLTERTPELTGLNLKKIVVIGAGAIGATSCIEFARAGIGELQILDHDFVDPATTPRWPLGIAAAGLLKHEAIDEFIASHYPYTNVFAQKHRIGLCRESAESSSDVVVLGELIEGADLIYDASAEIGINHLLSDIATKEQIPYISTSTTYGAWGGRLIRVRPGISAGCWMCYFSAALSGELPKPPFDPNGEVQPAGCGDPTFTGSSFDVSEVALAGVRLAIGTLQSGMDKGYPDVDWDVAIISIREKNGILSVPHWEVFPLNRHALCPNEAAHRKLSVVATTNR